MIVLTAVFLFFPRPKDKDSDSGAGHGKKDDVVVVDKTTTAKASPVQKVQPSNEPELIEVGCFKVRVGEFTDKDVLSGVGLVAAPVEFGVAWKWYINDQLFGEFDPTHDTVSQTVNSAGDRKESYILTAGRGRTEVDFVYCKYLGREPPANWYVLALHKRAKEASL